MRPSVITALRVIVGYVQFGNYLKSGKQNCICHTEGTFEGFHNNRVFIHLCLRTHLATKHQMEVILTQDGKTAFVHKGILSNTNLIFKRKVKRQGSNKSKDSINIFTNMIVSNNMKYSCDIILSTQSTSVHLNQHDF